MRPGHKKPHAVQYAGRTATYSYDKHRAMSRPYTSPNLIKIVVLGILINFCTTLSAEISDMTMAVKHDLNMKEPQETSLGEIHHSNSLASNISINYPLRKNESPSPSHIIHYSLRSRKIQPNANIHAKINSSHKIHPTIIKDPLIQTTNTIPVAAISNKLSMRRYSVMKPRSIFTSAKQSTFIKITESRPSRMALHCYRLFTMMVRSLRECGATVSRLGPSTSCCTCSSMSLTPMGCCTSRLIFLFCESLGPERHLWARWRCFDDAQLVRCRSCRCTCLQQSYDRSSDRVHYSANSHGHARPLSKSYGFLCVAQLESL